MPKLEEQVTPTELVEIILSGTPKTDIFKRYKTTDEELALVLSHQYREGNITKDEFNAFFKGQPLPPRVKQPEPEQVPSPSVAPPPREAQSFAAEQQEPKSAVERAPDSSRAVEEAAEPQPVSTPYQTAEQSIPEQESTPSSGEFEVVSLEEEREEEESREPLNKSKEDRSKVLAESIPKPEKVSSSTPSFKPAATSAEVAVPGVPVRPKVVPLQGEREMHTTTPRSGEEKPRESVSGADEKVEIRKALSALQKIIIEKLNSIDTRLAHIEKKLGKE